ncbi:quinohemoprotein amine dehydrogenase maturation protein [Noviherbaspirillum sp. CPCC 100848]|uniref:Quinohemoprotein amine dehydrogenase maturation protein n=1 Tax=Noviherbaspirillum album TaxID=3080276 RepID=A0ABU6JHB4_9BURK|nr:quinohemoprotein amine dehydrogenase maturation protein [Noviherbaspirillum sp. CPCC 100848]MEC4722808.1 quinohemoprotein amine dehydrogenase maturation protein [Noviherbaspirillum sp. CPCC 100848]
MNHFPALYLNTYNFHEVKTPDRSTLFHIPTSAMFRLDRIGRAVLDYLKEKNVVSAHDIENEFHDGSRGTPEEISAVLSDFQDLAILSPDEPKPDAGMKFLIRDFPINTIVLNVNTGCNLSCTYCYKEDLAVPSKGEKMQFETAKKSIDLVLAEGAQNERINVVFFGGEPLTNMRLIKQAVQYAEERCAELGKRVDFTMTTNATLLTEEIVDYLDEHHFGISISMDGPEAVHDRRRKTVGGTGTYTTVAKKARMLLERYRSRAVGARVTLTAGYTDVVAIHHHLKNELGFAEVGFAPATSGPISTFNLDATELRAVFDNMRTLGLEYRDAALEGKNTGFSNMHQMMSDLYEGRRKALPCGAGIGLLAVDKKGDLNLCHRFTGSEMPTFGNVQQGIDKAALGTFLEGALDRSGKGCSTCRIRNLCAGGCYHESYAHFSDPLSPTYHYCDLMREWVDFGMEIYNEIIGKNPRFFGDHIATRSH